MIIDSQEPTTLGRQGYEPHITQDTYNDWTNHHDGGIHTCGMSL